MNLSIFSELNWLHILVAASGYFIFGALWYTPLFGKRWAQLHGISFANEQEAMKGFAGIMVTGFLITFLITTGLAVIIEKLNLTELISGFKLGLFTGVLFGATAISITYLYLRKPLGLHLIEGGYHIIGQIIAAIILIAWR